MIVTAYGTIQSKGVVDDVCRHLAFQWTKDHPTADKADNPYSLRNADKIKKELEADPNKAKQTYPEVFYYFDGLINTRVSQSVHPAGMVISPITLDDHYGIFDKDGENCLMMDMA